MSAEFFRAGVGACVVNAKGGILALKRKGVAENAWQMPQGGIEAGEAPEEAVFREVQEETGLLRHDLTIIAEYSDWLVYELPVNARNPKVGRGQAQKWFVLSASASAVVTPDGKEFEDYDWFTPADLMPLVVRFRRPTYEKVFALLTQNKSRVPE